MEVYAKAIKTFIIIKIIGVSTKRYSHLRNNIETRAMFTSRSDTSSRRFIKYSEYQEIFGDVPITGYADCPSSRGSTPAPDSRNACVGFTPRVRRIHACVGRGDADVGAGLAAPSIPPSIPTLDVILGQWTSREIHNWPNGDKLRSTPDRRSLPNRKSWQLSLTT